MSAEKIHDALNHIDDGLIEKTNLLREGKRKPNRMWVRWGALAACLCLVMAGAWVLRGFSGGSTESMSMNYAADDSEHKDGAAPIEEEDAPAEAEAPAAESGEVFMSGIEIPKTEVDLYRHPELLADVEAFFIYQGRSYFQYAQLADPRNLVGEQLGTAAGLLDEWTAEEGYVELAGSVSGPFYEVAGYDPAFLLCMQQDDGSILIFINNNDISLSKGADLFENLLHMSGNVEKLEHEIHYSWYHNLGELAAVSDEYAQTLEKFVSELSEPEFMYHDSVELENSQCYHLYFRMSDGMTVNLTLKENGIVKFSGIEGVAIMVNSDVAGELLSILKGE